MPSHEVLEAREVVAHAGHEPEVAPVVVTARSLLEELAQNATWRHRFELRRKPCRFVARGLFGGSRSGELDLSLFERDASGRDLLVELALALGELGFQLPSDLVERVQLLARPMRRGAEEGGDGRDER